MRFLPRAVSLAVPLVSSPAFADTHPYIGAAFADTAGANFGFGIQTVGFDVVTGVRLSPWVSLEAVFSGRIAPDPSGEPTEGAACSGSATDQFHWETFGERVWIHVVHSTYFDLSLAPPGISVGPSYDQYRSLAPFGGCYRSPADLKSSAIVVDLFALSFEVLFTHHFGVRLGGTAGVVLVNSFGVIALSAFGGPVVHF